MSVSMSLNGKWKLAYAEGAQLVPASHLLADKVEGVHFFEADVPAPIHKVLMDAGVIEDPNFGINSLRARWVEEMFWVYRRVFTPPNDAMTQQAWLVFETLEYDAVVFLNGVELGRHASAHRPARFDVSGKLHAGENLLAVRISTGMHSLSDKPAEGYGTGDIGALTKRHWTRKPQYQSGWDWNARLMNVGILGNVRLEWCGVPRLDQVTVFAIPARDLSRASVVVRATIEGWGGGVLSVNMRAAIAETGQDTSLSFNVGPGETRSELKIEVEKPKLWWPIGHGEQNMYTVEVSLECGPHVQRAVRRIGVRLVEMDQSPHPVTGQYCTLKINNRPVFCKGGNWVPADMLYSTVEGGRLRRLVELAVEANFNILRVWGGGLFAGHDLLELCDRHGILVWHDMLFACGKYPGDDPYFYAEVNREITWAVREFAYHPSLVVWCGNNEVEWGDWAWGYSQSAPTHPHYAIFHHDIPLVVRKENPSALHWISSPFSPDQRDPNDPTVGDQHPWGVSLGDAGPADFWKYRKYVDRFPNEGGVLGASSPATLRRFLPETEQYLFSMSWNHHDNPFACTDHAPGAVGHSYSTVEFWTGRKPTDMRWDDYAFASAILQAEGLTEYIGNYRRRKFSSAAAIFWMYNDSWPVTHGWTIVDYYLRRKLAYHPVRRAFQPVTVVVVEEDGVVTVYGVNDTMEAWSGALHYGIFNLAGALPLDRHVSVTIVENSSAPLAQFDRRDWDQKGFSTSGAFAVLIQSGRNVAQHRLFLSRFKDLKFRKPDIKLSLSQSALTLSSPVFAWGVCLDISGEMPIADNCFDLLPGIPYAMPWDPKLGEPRIVKVASRDVFGLTG